MLMAPVSQMNVLELICTAATLASTFALRVALEKVNAALPRATNESSITVVTESAMASRSTALWAGLLVLDTDRLACRFLMFSAKESPTVDA
jgi:hypothetical protein